MSMKEMEFVADFILESFIHEHEQLKLSGKEKHFNLDKVCMFLFYSILIFHEANTTVATHRKFYVVHLHCWINAVALQREAILLSGVQTDFFFIYVMDSRFNFNLLLQVTALSTNELIHTALFKANVFQSTIFLLLNFFVVEYTDLMQTLFCMLKIF